MFNQPPVLEFVMGSEGIFKLFRPLFYLKFEDTSNLGLDSSGNNNHFTVNGTVTAGSDILG